jgi:hypothetical protein
MSGKRAPLAWGEINAQPSSEPLALNTPSAHAWRVRGRPSD